MPTLKRIVVLLFELIVEALLLGGFFGAMFANRIGILNGLLGSMIAVPVILALHGYYISRALAAVASVSKSRWLYPAIAAAVFIAHVLFIALEAKGDLSAQAQTAIPAFLAGGACLVFACSFMGNQLFKRWSRSVFFSSAGRSDLAEPNSR